MANEDQGVEEDNEGGLKLPPPPARPTSTVQGFWDGFWQAASSGLFFMLVGITFLIVAATTIGGTHAGLTFVFVVVGVAILLYGTGTQSAGSFDKGDKEAETRFKARLAGGAGVLAFAVAAGITFFSPEINLAFREETRYVEVYFVAKEDNSSTLIEYMAEVSIDGSPIPTIRRGKYIIALVPYNLTELRQTKKPVAPSNIPDDEEASPLTLEDSGKKELEARFIRPKPAALLKSEVFGEYTIDLSSKQYGGLLFDRYPKKLFVTLTAPSVAAGQPGPSEGPIAAAVPEPLAPQ